MVEATASEMEQAIIAAQNQPETPEVKEVVEQTPPPQQDKDEFDYKKAYEGLRSWQTKIAQEFSEVKKKSESPKETMTQDQFNDWYNRDPVSASRWLAHLEAESKVNPLEEKVKGLESTLTNILAESSINKFRSRFNDFDNLKPDIVEEIGKYPVELQENPLYYDKLLESSYYAAKGKKSKDIEERARQEERQKVHLKSQAKQDAYVEGSSVPTSESPLSYDKMSSKELFEVMKSKGMIKE